MYWQHYVRLHGSCSSVLREQRHFERECAPTPPGYPARPHIILSALVCSTCCTLLAGSRCTCRSGCVLVYKHWFRSPTCTVDAACPPLLRNLCRSPDLVSLASIVEVCVGVRCIHYNRLIQLSAHRQTQTHHMYCYFPTAGGDGAWAGAPLRDM
jgi:hypothetical protein